jgi:hypothetical protein
LDAKPMRAKFIAPRFQKLFGLLGIGRVRGLITGKIYLNFAVVP